MFVYAKQNRLTLMTGEVLVGLGSRRKVSKGVVLEGTLAVRMVSRGIYICPNLSRCVHFFVCQLCFNVGKGEKKCGK